MTERFKRRIDTRNKRDVMKLVWEVVGELAGCLA